MYKNGIDLLPENEIDKSDIVIFNTCTVKSPTENKITFMIDKFKSTDKKIVIAGCLSQSDPEFIKKRYPKSIILGVNAARDIIQSLQIDNSYIDLPIITPKHKQNKEMFEKDWLEKPLMGSTQWNNNLNIIQINEGCVNYCTFCATKFARGKLKSYQLESIISAIRNTNSSEVWLTSQDTACWGFDIKSSLPQLIEEINKINRKHWIRIGMGNPNNMIKILDKLIEVYKSKNIYKFLHVPIQSGSNNVLKHMKRGYTVEEYLTIINKFKKEFPKITISTDVICGYPTETEEDFNSTMKIIEQTKPSICNISRYWERKGTIAASLKQLNHSERKRRSTKLTQVMRKIQQDENKKWLGWEGEILLSEYGIKGGIQGRNLFYKAIIIHDTSLKLGSWINVRITGISDTYLIGEQVISK